MKVVADVNIVLSSLLTKGNSSKVFNLNYIFSKFDFISPDFILEELAKHKEEFFKRTKLSEYEFNETIEFLLEQITIVPRSEFSDFLQKAREMLPNHLKDIQYLALALRFNCPIFSGDKTLKELLSSSNIKVFPPREMLSKFETEI